MFFEQKEAFGRYLTRFYETIEPTTPQLERYVERGVEKSIAYAPARMIDAAEEMFIKYLRADIERGPTQPYQLPMILVAMARDVTPTGRDYTRQVADAVPFVFPDDELQRVFKLKTVASDIRVQVAFFAAEEATARSLAAQLLLFVDSVENRRFYADFEKWGFHSKWPCVIESPETFAPVVQTEANNLTILAMDLTLKCTLPIYLAPKEYEENDGKGIAGDKYDPAGFPVVQVVENDGKAVK